MKSEAKSVAEYLDSLPPDRRAVISAIRDIILTNLPSGYEETMLCGMIGYVVPHSIYPAGYHCDPSQPLPYAFLGSQKNHMAIYLMTVYGDAKTEQWFRDAFKAAGKKLDMGKSCVRFKKLEDLPLDVIGEVIARVPVQAYISRIQEGLAAYAAKKKPKKKK